MKKNNKKLNENLIENKYTFKELINLEQLERLFALFSASTGFTIGLMTYPEQELLISTGWRKICTAFHRVHPVSEKHCKASNLELTRGLKKLREINISQCKNGMVNGATPIIIRGAHVANLFTGQVFFQEPDMAYFKKQGEEYGYDIEAYLKTFENIPVVDEEKLRKPLKFLSEIAATLAEEGLKNLENNEVIQRAEKSEERYRSLFNSVPVGIYRSTPDGRFLDGNFALMNILGYPNSEIMLSSDIQNLYLEIEDRKKELNLIEENDEVVDYIIQLRRYDGEIIWIKDSLKVVRDFSGKTLYFYGRLEDITEQTRVENALRKSEANLRAFMDNARGFGVYSTKVERSQGRKMSFTFVSPSVDEITGIENPTEKSDLFQYVHKDDIARVKRANKVSRETGKSFDQDFRSYHTKKEEWRWFHVISSAVIQDNRNFTYFNGLILDITKQKRIEIALKEEETKYRSVIEQSNDVIYLLYQDHFEMVNPKFTEIFEVTAEEACAPEFDFMTLVASKSRSLLKERTQQVARGENIPLRYEFTALKKDGTEIDMEVTVSYIAYKEGIATQGILRDITERKKTAGALKESEERYRALFQDNPSMYFTVNESGVVLSVNSYGAEHLGYRIDELVGEEVLGVFHPEDKKTVQNYLAECFQDIGHTKRWEIRKIRKDGSQLWVHERVRVIKKADGESIALIVCDDITERKKSEKELVESNRQLKLHIDEIEKLQFELREQALRDPLTGLFNRRYMEEALEQELAKARRRGMPLSLVVLDLDNLKKINDGNGHFTGGDEALKTLADTLRKLCRTEDIISRYGGDEFLVVLYDTSVEIACKRAIEWKEALAKVKIDSSGNEFSVTFSAGIASFPLHGSTTEEILVNADDALYRAKKDGRDKVAIYV